MIPLSPALTHSKLRRARERGSLSEVTLDLKNVGAAQFLRSEFYRFYVPGIGNAEIGGKESAIIHWLL